jgi:hypothetical protein
MVLRAIYPLESVQAFYAMSTLRLAVEHVIPAGSNDFPGSHAKVGTSFTVHGQERVPKGNNFPFHNVTGKITNGTHAVTGTTDPQPSASSSPSSGANWKEAPFTIHFVGVPAGTDYTLWIANDDKAVVQVGGITVN